MTTQRDTAGITEMIRVTDATYLNAFRIRIALSDGIAGIADFRGRLDGPIFEPLNDPVKPLAI